MQELISHINQDVVFAFLLLLARILSFMAFMPIVSHKSVNATTRIAMSFYFTVFLYPLVEIESMKGMNDQEFLLALISEITLGLVASFLVQLVFLAVQIVGDLIGYATALSMANMFDPTTGTQQGVMSRFLYLFILVIYLETGMYEVTIYMLSNSIGQITLGSFNLFEYNGIKIAVDEVNTMFAFAFSFAFPLFFIGFIMDVYYGYGTKSMPAFSPFIITFQIKFALIFIFMMLGFEAFVDGFTSYFINKFG
ncbi:MAG: flagellar biosynthetic protein FliR [Campylobacterales bacterium]|nr:flagellar biosynthetic protein FliR [Campylobacterales bacterium]